MTAPVRVLLVDDDALVRAGLTMMLDGVEGIVVVAQASDGAEVPGVLNAHTVDVVLMDIRMPGTDGISATRQVRARADPPEVIILTTFDADENVLRALRAGAGGFLLKDSPPADLADAVVKVAAGDPILSPRITRRLMERAATEAGAYERARSALAALSDREHEVALAVGQGRTNAEIAASLSVSVATVKAHMTRIMAKLGFGNRTQIALLMHDAGLC
ncbi:response regulator transcription factor [Saccharomonospora sp. NPDC006951]